MAKHTLLIRGDANTRIGTGHVMRCLALAQVWQDNGGTVTFLMAPGSPSLEQRIRTESMNVLTITEQPGSDEDAAITAEIAKKNESSWVVVDGYQFGANYQKILKEHNCRILFIDDYGHAEHYYADLVLNQNIYAADEVRYPDNPGMRLLLGPRYALLRKEIISWKYRRHPNPEKAFNILVTLGGSDPGNASLHIIKVLQQLPEDFFSAKIIVGGSNPHLKSISRSLDSSKHAIELLHDVRNMGEFFAWADLAITAGGSTTLELAYIGVPMITVVIADNQKRVCESLQKRKAAINLGVFDRTLDAKFLPCVRKVMNSLNLRNELSRNATELVDGKGAERVADIICGPNIILEKARPKDCWTVFYWINDPYVREVSFSSKPILWDEHMKWFLEKIVDPNTHYFIILTRDRMPVGQVRFEVDHTDATISILIDPTHRGKNISVHAMHISTKILFESTAVTRVHAYIKTSNKISCKAFRKAGFVYSEIFTRGLDKAYHMILKQE